MMDFCYIFGGTNNFDGLDLRISLRSLQYYYNLDKVILVGDDPGFLNDNVLYIKNSPISNDKETRIMEQVMAVCGSNEISDEFCLINDDYCFLSYIEPKYYNKGSIYDSMVKFTGSPYCGNLLATQVALKEQGFTTRNHDCHFPIVYSKEKLADVVNMYDWDVPQGMCLKSLYCNTLGLDDGFIKDCKIYRQNEQWENWPMVSLPDTINRIMLKKLLTLFPNKSIYEV